MIVLVYALGSLALLGGTALVVLSLVRMEQAEPKGRVGRGWLEEERRRQWR